MGARTSDNVTTVCLFSPGALPLIEGIEGRVGGAELDVWQIATALALDPAFRPSLATIGDRSQRRTIGGVQVLAIARYRANRTRRGHFLRYCFRVIRSLRSVHADVYLCKGASLEALLCFVATRIGSRKPFVFRFQHDWETARDTLTNRLFSGRRLLATLFIAALRRADALVAQTSVQQQALRRSFGLESTVLYNSHPVMADVSLTEKSTVLWIGRAASYKRPEVFLTLARRLPNHRFVMVATFDENHSSVLPSLREQALHLPNLRLIEGASRNEVELLFRAARVYVLSSEAEGFPNVLVEACRSATPVASLRVDPDGLIRLHEAGFVTDDDVDALARVVEALLTNDALFQRLANNAYSLARTRLNIETTIDGYKQIFMSGVRRANT